LVVGGLLLVASSFFIVIPAQAGIPFPLWGKVGWGLIMTALQAVINLLDTGIHQYDNH
jgi:hypothetical protein